MRKKQAISRKVTYINILFTIMFLGACSNSLVDIDPLQSSKGSGRLSVFIGEGGSGSARTIMPAEYNESAITNYDISLSGTKIDSVNATIVTHDFTNLPIGDYTVTVNGKNISGDVVASGNTTTTVTDGGSALVVVELKPTQSGQGDIDITFDWLPAGLPEGTIDSVVATLNKEGESSTPLSLIITDDSINYTDTVSSGFYTLIIYLKNGTELYLSVVEMIHVYDGLDTSATISFNISDFTPSPDTPEVKINSVSPIKGSEELDFEISGGEEGKTYNYLISSDGGGTHVTGSGIFDVSGGVSITDIDVSSLRDGELVVTVNQTDAIGHKSSDETDTIILDQEAVNIPVFDLPRIDTDNVTNGSITITGEQGSTYDITITSTEGGEPLTYSGTFDDSGIVTINPIDFSGLNDGYLIMSVSVTDESANESVAIGVVEKDTLGLTVTTDADFSGEGSAVTFDITNHGKQTIPSGIVKYDTDTLIGSDYDDVIKFSELESDEVFTIDGKAGYNIIDLTNYPSYNVTVDAGSMDTGDDREDDGTILINIDGGSVTINYTDFQRINFSSNNFTGSPHAIELDTSENTEWTFSGTTFDLETTVSGYKTGVIHFEGSLGLNYQLDTTFLPFEDFINKNGLIIFDYIDDNNFKYIRAYANANKWSIGEKIDGTTDRIIDLSEEINQNTANPLQLRVTGEDGKTAELWSDGIKKLSHTFDDVLNDGFFGLSNDRAHTEFTINMTPSNWAPYAESYEEMFSSDAMDDLTLDLIGHAVDDEDEYLYITTISTSANGTIIDNGNGTVTYTPNNLFYGIDIYTYTISDGSNTTTAEIRINVLP